MNSVLTEIHKHQAHVHQIRDVDFSPCWAKFVTCGDDGIVKIFDFIEWEVELEIIAHGADIITCQWHPFESLIATAGRQMEIRLWDPRCGYRLHQINFFILKSNWIISLGNLMFIGTAHFFNEKSVNSSS